MATVSVSVAGPVATTSMPGTIEAVVLPLRPTTRSVRVPLPSTVIPL